LHGARPSKGRSFDGKEAGMKRLGMLLAGVVIGGVVALQIPSAAQDNGSDPGTDTRTVTASGNAHIHAKPDEAVVTLGVRTSADTAQAAMDQNSQAMTEVLDALRALGLGDKDLATQSIDLSPRWDNRGQEVIGYEASNSVEVTIHDLNMVGRVIDTGVSSGANIAGGIQFRVSDENQGVEDALASAVSDAKAKADAMAAAADATVGQAMTITQGGGQSQPPIYAQRVAYAAADLSVPIEAPTIDTQVDVIVTWELV